MADTYIKILGTSIVAGEDGKPITSTVVGDKRALDVNVTGGDIIIDNPTIVVDINAFGASPDSVLIVGSEDGTTTGIRHVAIVDADGNLVVAQDGVWNVTAVDFDIRNLTFASDKVDATGSAVSVANFPAIQPVSGIVTANQGTNPWIVAATDLDIRNLTFASDKVDVSGSTLGANSGVDIGDITVNNASGAAAVNIQDGGNSITVDGTVSISGSVVVTGPLTDAQLRASPVPISGTITATPTGTQDVNIVSTIALPVTDNGGSLTVDGTVATTQSGIWTNTVTQATGTNLHTVVDSGSIAVSNFPATQPVSGTVIANQGTSPWVVGDGGGSLTVDNAGTFAVQAAQSGAWSVAVNNGAGASAVNIQDGGNSITVDGTVAVSGIGGTVAVTQSTSPWVVSGTTTVNPANGSLTDRSSTATTASSQVAAANANRKYFYIQNVSGGIVWINFGTAAVAAPPSIRIANGEEWRMEGSFISTQAINIIAASGSRDYTAKEG